MNILHISSVSSQANGIGIVLTALAEEQRRLGHNVKVITVQANLMDLDGLFINISRKDDFECLLDLFRPDIAVFHSIYIKEYLIFSRILEKNNVPYLIKLHGALSKMNYQKNRFKKWLANFLFYNRFIKRAQLIIYLNKGEYENSIVPQINTKTAIIPNGCYLPSKKYLCEFVDRIEYLYLGRIERHHKALDVLLSALKYLQDIGYDKKIHFTFYGTGEKSEMCWFKNEMKYLHLIADFKGAAYGSDKEFAFQHAHIFVLTSRSEGMPMAVLEALSYGLPCILTPQTNMTDEVLKYKAGWVTYLSVDSIINTIISSIVDYNENHMIYNQQALSLASTFDWNKITRKSIDLYLQIIHSYRE